MSVCRVQPRQRITRIGAAWLLGLVLLLPLAGAVAAWHAYAHDSSDASSESAGKQGRHLGDCGLCLAAAAIGGAPQGEATLAVPPSVHAAPLPARAQATWQPRRHRLYAVRAPPLVAR